MKVLLFCSLLSLVFSMPTGNDQDDDTDMSDDESMDYLKLYGWMGEENPMLGSLTDADAFPKAIADFQSFAGITVTGKLDAATIKMMKMRRCGVKDVLGMGSVSRKKRYTLEGSKWQNTVVSYRVSRYSQDMSRNEADIEIDRAFIVWSSVANIQFVRVSANSNADIDIQFAERSHGDMFDFDGPGGTLAHAFFPRWGGNTHFDDDENFTFNSSAGINLFQVAAHEFGHSLGLSHSAANSALMYPFYRGYQPNFVLDQDDIRGIQQIYGARVDMMETTRSTGTTPRTTSMPPVVPGMPNPCSDGHVDAIVMMEDDRVYAFRDNYYMMIDEKGIVSGYPRKIRDDWEGLPDDIDAAITFNSRYDYIYSYYSGRYTYTKILEERLFIFKDTQVYLYERGTKNLASGYPKSISEVFPGLPSHIDSAFRWSGNDRTYFSKGNQYYRYSHGRILRTSSGYFETVGSVDMQYPRPLSVWKNLPNKVDATFQWVNGRTYFFSGDQYYRFDDNNFQVDTTQRYPRSTRAAWFGCTANIDNPMSTTMMMEADMMNDEKFDVMENVAMNSTDTDTSGQERLSSLSFVTCIVISLIMKLFN